MNTRAPPSIFCAGPDCPATIGTARRGAIAQLGERLDRTQEVAGSSPASSIRLRRCWRRGSEQLVAGGELHAWTLLGAAVLQLAGLDRSPTLQADDVRLSLGEQRV